MSNIRERLEERCGYFGNDEIDDMIAEFGENFIIVIKFRTHDRIFTSLKRLKELPKKYPALNADIKEVFISATTYLELF